MPTNRTLTVIAQTFLAFALVVASEPARAQPLYRVTQLQDLGNTTLVRDINDGAVMVGIASGFNGDTAFRAVRWLPDGSVQLLGLGRNSDANALNNQGQIVGRYSTALVPGGEAVLWDNGVTTDLGVLNAGDGQSGGMDINEASQIVGFSSDANRARAVRFDNPGVTDLGSIAPVEPLGGAETFASAVNASSQIVGLGRVGANTGFCTHPTDGTDCRAMIHENGVMRNLELEGFTLGGGGSQAVNNNDAGAIVGFEMLTFGTDLEQRGILLDGGVTTDLGSLGGNASSPWDLNEKGVVVGFSAVFVGDLGRAFIWIDGTMHNVNDLIDPTDPLFGTFTAYEARGINESGQLIANGIGNGGIRSWLLTPVYEDQQSYKCYLVKEPGRRTFQSQYVTLDDPFGLSDAKLLTPYELCTPVDKNGESISDPHAHLMCYKLRSYAPRARRHVTDSDQFGDEALTVGSPIELCVPAIKNEEGERSIPELESVLNHFQCYRATGDPQFGPLPPVSLVDQFEAKDTELTGTALHCNAVAKNEGFVPDPANRLKCYDIADVAGQAAFPGAAVTTLDQFGPLALEVGRPNRLCELASEE